MRSRRGGGRKPADRNDNPARTTPGPPGAAEHALCGGLRTGSGTGPGGLTPRTEPGNVLRVAPRTAERPGWVRVRSLRTQQRTESQCQLFINPVIRGPFEGYSDVGFLWYITSKPARHGPAIWVLLPLRRESAFLHCRSGRRACVVTTVHMTFNGEFDPGSGRTLAACLTHASRTERPACGYSSGERVSNTWATCPQLWDNTWKQVLIPDIDLRIAWCVG